MRLAEIEEGLCSCIVDSARPRLHSSSFWPALWLHWMSDGRVGCVDAACLAAKTRWSAERRASQGSTRSVRGGADEKQQNVLGRTSSARSHVSTAPAGLATRWPAFCPHHFRLSRVLAMPASGSSCAHHLACVEAPPSLPTSSPEDNIISTRHIRLHVCCTPLHTSLNTLPSTPHLRAIVSQIAARPSSI